MRATYFHNLLSSRFPQFVEWQISTICRTADFRNLLSGRKFLMFNCQIFEFQNTSPSDFQSRRDSHQCICSGLLS